MATGSPPATDISDTPPTPTTTTTTGDSNNSANTTTSTTTTSATSGTSSPTNTTTTTTSTATNTDAVVTTTTTATTTTNDDGSQVKNNNNTTINNNNNYHNGSPKAGTNDDQQHRDTQTPSDKVNGSTTGLRRGKCKWFNVAKGWGFITPNDGGQDVFVHQSVIQMLGFRSLGDDEEIDFECKVSDKGLEATLVQGVDGNDCHGSHRRPMSKKKFRRLRCYNCGEFANHIASKCTLGPQPKKCHNCKGEDHLIADCPQRRSDDSRSKSVSSDSSSTAAAPSSSSQSAVSAATTTTAATNTTTDAPKQNEKAA